MKTRGKQGKKTIIGLGVFKVSRFLSENCSRCVKENGTQRIFKMAFHSFSNYVFSYISVIAHYLESHEKIKH